MVQNHNIGKEIDGFAIHEENNIGNYIFINSAARNSGAQSFTLAHELAHILSHRSAISNNYENDNQVEAYCNVFAANLLLPREDFLTFCRNNHLSFHTYKEAIESAHIVAETFCTSVSMVLVRAHTIGLSATNHYPQFKEGFGQKDFLDSVKYNKQRGGPKDGPAPGVVDRAYLGNKAANIIVEALTTGVTNYFEVFERVGLSKSRINGLVDLVRREVDG